MHSSTDVGNFLTFLQLLRQDTYLANRTIAVAMKDQPYDSNMTAWALTLDYIELMNYDVWLPGRGTPVGPNSPLYSGCGLSVPTDAASDAIATYSIRGFPAEQLLLVVPTFGQVWNVTPGDAYDAASSGSALQKNGCYYV